MKRFLSRSGSLRFLAAAFAFAMTTVSPAMATAVTFAQYFQSNGSQQQWTISTLGDTTTVSASGDVYFEFSGVSGLPFSGPEAAIFTLIATSAQEGNCVSCDSGESFVQPGYSGTFSFIDASLGTNLLSGIFAVTGSPSTTGAQFSSSIGSSGGSFNASATAGNLDQLVLTSAYLDFIDQTQQNASWSLSSLVPMFAVDPGLPSGTFHASGSGTFSADPGPEVVPEPATLGPFGALLGFGVLRRKRSSRQ